MPRHAIARLLTVVSPVAAYAAYAEPPPIAPDEAVARPDDAVLLAQPEPGEHELAFSWRCRR